MRAIAPHWQAQKASWGEAVCLFEDLASPAMWLCRLVAAMERENVHQSLPEPVIQLLTSSVATFLKAAKAAGISVDYVLPCDFTNVPAVWRPAARVLPAATSFLLPRMAAASKQQGTPSMLLSAARALDATLGLSQHRDPELCPLMVLGSCHTATLVSKMLAELLHCSGPATTRFDSHYAVGMLSSYAAYLSTEIAFRADQGYKGAPFGSAQLRDLLARPLLQLLHSPLLDTLAALQHVMVDKIALQRVWESSAGASICERHQTLLGSTESDAVVSRTAMQVGHSFDIAGFNIQTLHPPSHLLTCWRQAFTRNTGGICILRLNLVTVCVCRVASLPLHCSHCMQRSSASALIISSSHAPASLACCRMFGMPTAAAVKPGTLKAVCMSLTRPGVTAAPAPGCPPRWTSRSCPRQRRGRVRPRCCEHSGRWRAGYGPNILHWRRSMAAVDAAAPPTPTGRCFRQSCCQHPQQMAALLLHHPAAAGARGCGASTPPAPTWRGPASWRSRRTRAAGAAGCGTAALNARRRAGGMGTG